MYYNRLHAWWSTQSRSATLLSSLFARRWVRLQTLWRFQPKELSIDEMVGACCFGCLSGPRGLPVGFLLLWYSVLFTVESLSLLYFLVISWFICSRRWWIDKLGVFHANQISMCLIHIWIKGDVGAVKPSPPVKHFTDRSKAVLLLRIINVFFCLEFAMHLCVSVYMCLVVTCWERADLFALVCGV